MGEETAYPQRFGPYALLCALGRGGMGAVHLAKHGGVAGIEKYCVVKTLRQRHADNEEYITRFMDEARVVVHLAHRNICPIFDVGRVGSRYYLAMELIEGRDLNTLLERCWDRGRPVPTALALHIACEVLEALDYAHRRAHPVSGEPLHIVHRDVSPHNVMVNFEGEVKLIDFGLAASSLKVERTDPKIVLGKLSYMSREHLRAQPVDGRHDLFGVAVMLYEMLAGERYYAGVPPEQLLPLLAEGEHVPRRFHELDDELRAILSRALAKEARLRTATCGELRDQLQQYMLRRQLSASARDLRGLVEELFPGEQASIRALLQRFQGVRPPTHPDEQSRVIARASAVAAIPEARPITEPTGRLEVPAPPPRPSASAARREPTVFTPRVDAQADMGKARHTVFYGASATVLVLGAAAAAAWFFLLAPSILESNPRPAPSHASTVPPSSNEEEPEIATAQNEAERPQAPEPDIPTEPPPPASVDGDAALAPVEAGVKPEKVAKTKPPARRVVRPRTRTSAKPPPLPADATPEEKVRYLDDHCRAHSCGRSLVQRFEDVGLAGMSTDEVRSFWPRVNRCVEVCSGP